ncbi:CLUMA_CG000941, isoform A [Clunio marinus]|uniref:CLUMA_CG000941, isoform A n=1 Tax=Clunio marinus TaxID=568069 RepID=A0A1J1HI95_9DIPT|nr:CLUMA_CG000941, isoform A [Clunio marinus]
MALDGKAIKEEIPDKEVYDSGNVRRMKGKEQCNTPDSPEGARVIAPRSPMSPHQIHPVNTMIPANNRSSSVNRHNSSSPTANGTPPPTVTPSSASTLLANSLSAHDSQRLLKIRRFLGALVQFGQDTNVDVGDRLRSLVLSLASGGLSIEDFQIAVQEATNFPLRPNVLPFLRSHLPLLQREINSLARVNKQSALQYVRTNDSSVIELLHNPTDAHNDIFLSNESNFSSNSNGLNLKRRATEALIYESHLANSNLSHEWNDYISPAKRPHHSLMLSSSALPHLINHPSLFEYQNGIHSHQEQMHTSREERELRSITSESSSRGNRVSGGAVGQVNGSGSGATSGDEEWRNIHTMLSCISGMVEKTKRAISILQHRGGDGGTVTHQDSTLISDIKRQTEEKIAEFRRNAEDAVNQVKRQAVLEIQRAVSAAETRAIEMIAQERIKMEKIYGEINRSGDGIDGEHQTTGSNACWNCGRKANETCSGCNLARYCGSFCQHKDWEQHHQACGTNAARSANEAQLTTPKSTSVQQTRSTANTISSNSSSSRSSPINQTTSVSNSITPVNYLMSVHVQHDSDKQLKFKTFIMESIMKIFSLLVVIVGLIAYLVNRSYSYWKIMGVPYEEPSFPVGNLKGIGHEYHQSKVFQRIYEKFKNHGTPFAGIYSFLSPVVLVTSVDFARTVLAKDSAYFLDRGVYYNEEDDPLSAHLFNVDNPKWKILRTKLTPTFTSGKMKMMFGTVCDVAEKFIKTLETESSADVNNEIEIKDIAARFTTDVIGSCAFGLDCSSLEDPKSEFREKTKILFDDPKYNAFFVQLILMFKNISKILHVTMFRKESTDFFMNIVKSTVNYRESNDVKRNDFMHLLIQLKNRGALEGDASIIGKLSIEEIAAQALIFFLAGFETSSTAMSYALFEMSQNPAIQQKARDNVREVLKRHDGQFTYEALMEMTYIDNCLSESLRKYPPVTNLTRSCAKDYQVEGTKFVIKKNQMVFIPAYSIHHDSQIYPNPSVFNPDRFSPEEQAKRSPYAFLAFGQGPRNCIGLRFGIMQAKIGLAMLLTNFKFEPCPRSVNPIVFSNELFILTPKDGVYLKVTKI